jgi:hypothetical protein
MLIFLSWIIGLAASLCAIPLLFILGVGGLAGTVAFLYDKDFMGILGALVGVLWSWAGFSGLSGYWRWIDLHGETLNEQDLERLTSIQSKGILGVLAFLPILPVFSWFVIPICCFIAYIFWDLKQKISKLRS